MIRSRCGRVARVWLLGTAAPAFTLSLATDPVLAQQTASPITEPPEILIEAPPLPLSSVRQISVPDAPAQTPVPDAGAYLRQQPGVSGARMGGHGIDPVIRGQQGNRLNIVNDGAYTFGGCPNRMDPPSSFVPVETYDRVTITQGYQSVTNGPGGSGGTVSFDRDPPLFDPGKPYRIKLGGGWVSNGNTRDAFVDVAGGAAGYYARAIGNWKRAANYDDGSGNEVRSAFRQQSGDLALGYDQVDGPRFELGVKQDRIADALFPGAGMDLPLSEDRSMRLKAAYPMIGGRVRELRVNAYVSNVDHIMDNYSVRPRTAPMAMRVEADFDTYGGTVAGDIVLREMTLTVGADLQANAREAERFRGMTDANVTTQQSILWPDTRIRQFGVFAEGKMPLDQGLRMIAGARFDRVDVSLDRADEVVAVNGRSPNSLYGAYYGATGDDVTEHNVGGLVRFEYDLSRQVALYAGLSRSVRTADATERSIASDMMASSWIGNPDIEPEQHHQAEIGGTYSARTWSVGGNVYVNRVSDFILRDTARGQDGILLANGATIYRNVDALLSGITFNGKYRIAGKWLLGGDLAYTYGENLDDDRALAQIPPLEASLTLTYQGKGWRIGTRLRGALKQTRVDADPTTGSGLDTGKTPSWFTQDLFASISLVAPFELKLGVTNLFDRTYAYHLNRANAFDPTQVQVNEPGRSYYARVTARF